MQNFEGIFFSYLRKYEGWGFFSFICLSMYKGVLVSGIYTHSILWKQVIETDAAAYRINSKAKQFQFLLGTTC